MRGHEVIDDGPASDASVDYPDFAALVAKKVSSGEVERGILICGTGIGMAICRQQIPGRPRRRLRRRSHRRTQPPPQRPQRPLPLRRPAQLRRSTERLVDIWMKTDFEGGRHQRRVEKIRDLEKGARGLNFRSLLGEGPGEGSFHSPRYPSSCAIILQVTIGPRSGQGVSPGLQSPDRT